MGTRIRFIRLAAAASLVLGLAACDKTPLDNSTASAEDTELAQTANQATFGNLIAALNNITVQIDRVNALNDLTVTDVQVVNVDNILNNSLNQNVVRILENARLRNLVEIGILQDLIDIDDTLNNFDILRDALVNVLVQDVIAINVLSGGDVVVFAQ